MSLYSTNNILITNNNSITNRETINLMYEEVSYFYEAMDTIKENDKVITNESISDFIFSTRESKNKCMNILDIMWKLLKQIVQMFTKLLEKLWNKFKSAFIHLENKTVIIKKYESVLQNYGSTLFYDSDRYVFTNLDAQQYIVFKSAIDTLYLDLDRSLKSISSMSSNYVKYYGELKKIEESIGDTESFLSNVRGSSIGRYDTVSKDEYATELFKYFRNGGTEINSDISSSEIMEAYKNFNNLKSRTDNIGKDKQNLIQNSKTIEKELSNLSVDKNLIDNNPELMKLFKSIIDDALNKVNGVCNIFGLFFSAKMDATTDAYMQDKSICMKAIEQYIQNGGKQL